MELIQQIKAMESMATVKPAFVDLTNTAGHALLSEMSIAELKERIKILKDEEEQRNKDKHDKIVREKQDKNKKIVDTLELIHKFKNELKTEKPK